MSSTRLQRYALIAEIIGGAAIVISLGFVGVGIKNNTEATEAATREAINQKDLDFLSLRLDSSILAQAHAKWEDGEELTPIEVSQLTHQEYVNFVAFEHSYYQFQKGILEPEEWNRHENIVRLQIQEVPYARRMWEQKQQTFGPEFRELVKRFAPGAAKSSDN